MNEYVLLFRFGDLSLYGRHLPILMGRCHAYLASLIAASKFAIIKTPFVFLKPYLREKTICLHCCITSYPNILYFSYSTIDIKWIQRIYEQIRQMFNLQYSQWPKSLYQIIQYISRMQHLFAMLEYISAAYCSSTCPHASNIR